jgi:hypothetical protein
MVVAAQTNITLRRRRGKTRFWLKRNRPSSGVIGLSRLFLGAIGDVFAPTQSAAIAGHDRLQHILPAVSTVDDAGTKTAAAMAGDVLADARTGRNGRHALVGCRGNLCSDGLPNTRMSTTQNVCDIIRRCAGLSAAKRLQVRQHRRARWDVSRRAG